MANFFRDSNLFKPRRGLSGISSALRDKEKDDVLPASFSGNVIQSIRSTESEPQTPIQLRRDLAVESPEGADTDEDNVSDDSFQIVEVRDISGGDEIQLEQVSKNASSHSELTGSTKVASQERDFEHPLLVSISALKKQLDQNTKKLVFVNNKCKHKDDIIDGLQRKCQDSSSKLTESLSREEHINMKFKSLKEKNDDIAGRLSEERLRSAGLEKNIQRLIESIKDKEIIKDKFDSMAVDVRESALVGQTVLSNLNSGFKTIEASLADNAESLSSLEGKQASVIESILSTKLANFESLSNCISKQIAGHEELKACLKNFWKEEHMEIKKSSEETVKSLSAILEERLVHLSEQSETVVKELTKRNLEFEDSQLKLLKNNEVTKILNGKILELEDSIDTERREASKMKSLAEEMKLKYSEAQLQINSLKSDFNISEQLVLTKDHLLKQSTSNIAEKDAQLKSLREALEVSKGQLKKLENSQEEKLAEYRLSIEQQAIQQKSLHQSYDEATKALKTMEMNMQQLELVHENSVSEVNRLKKEVNDLKRELTVQKSAENKRLCEKNKINDLVEENKRIKDEMSGLEQQLKTEKTQRKRNESSIGNTSSQACSKLLSKKHAYLPDAESSKRKPLTQKAYSANSKAITSENFDLEDVFQIPSSPIKTCTKKQLRRKLITDTPERKMRRRK